MEILRAQTSETKKDEDREAFLARLKEKFKDEEVYLIDYAYDIAKEAHRTQVRDAGGRYFEHPRACALIALDELGIRDPNMIITALLHDTAEDTPIFGNVTGNPSLFIKKGLFRLTKTFNEDVADMVMALTKLKYGEGTRFATKEDMLSFYFQNLLKHPKAVVLKAVDRLHNLRTLPVNGVEKIRKQIKETEDRILPLLDDISLADKSALAFELGKLKSLLQIELERLQSIDNQAQNR